MMRLLGFLTGATGVIGAMVMLLGAPAMRDAAEVEAERSAAAAPTGIDKLAGDHDAGDYDVPVSVVEPAPDPPANPEPASDARVEVMADTTSPDSTPTESPAEDRPATDALWHPFWQPFRSQIAANGFASRLTAITGIDYRVLRLKPGAYQVAFAYTDDLERNAKLAQIESATGLRVAEATP